MLVSFTIAGWLLRDITIYMALVIWKRRKKKPISVPYLRFINITDLTAFIWFGTIKSIRKNVRRCRNGLKRRIVNADRRMRFKRTRTNKQNAGILSRWPNQIYRMIRRRGLSYTLSGIFHNQKNAIGFRKNRNSRSSPLTRNERPLRVLNHSRCRSVNTTTSADEKTNEPGTISLSRYFTFYLPCP